MVFAYYLEDHPEFGPGVNRILGRMKQRGDILYTSVFTFGELLVRPMRDNNMVLVDLIKSAIAPPAVELISLSRPVMERYSAIRATTSAQPADAIHLACAAESGTDLFLTNDRRLHKLTVRGIQFIAGLNSGLL